VSDGTPAGTVLVKDINPGTGSSWIDSFAAVGDKVYFSAANPSHGNELWATQGTSATTTLIVDIIPGTASANPTDLTAFDAQLFFQANTPQSGQELWSSDGTSAGTMLIKDARAGTASSTPANLTVIGAELFFTAIMSTTQVMLWKTDGMPAGTQLVAPVCTGMRCSQFERSGIRMAGLGSLLLLSGSEDEHGQELWGLDRSSAETRLIKNISVTGVGSNPQLLTEMDGQLFFAANQRADNNPWSESNALWISDGSAAGTRPITTFQTLNSLTGSNHQVIFMANDGVSGLELWRSDGTISGTFQLKDIRPGPGSSLNFSFRPMNAQANGEVFFVANDGVSGSELWKTDGTISGTLQVRDIVPGSGSSGAQNLTTVDETIFFSAWDAANGRELWRTDGTISGTLLVKDIKAGTASSAMHDLVAFKNQLFFVTHHPDYGYELWKSDGTAAGTVIVKDIVPGTSGTDIGRLTPVGDTLFFTSFNSITGMVELWKSDGSEAGTVKITHLQLSTTGNIGDFTAHNGRLFFTMAASGSFSALWQSDGTLTGTLKIVPAAGEDSAWVDAGKLKSAGASLFMLVTEKHGEEFWVYDDSSAGLRLWQNIAPEGISAAPADLTLAGDRLFFSADDTVHGRELWSSAPVSIPPTYSLYLARIAR
jgi:ELWxxDGT repeat protein